MSQPTGRHRRELAPLTTAIASGRARLARSVVARAAVLAVVAAIGMWAGGRVVDDARNERQAWGAAEQVWVAVVDHRPGDRAVVERRSVPIAVRPPTAWDGDQGAAVMRAPVAAGEIVVVADVVPDTGEHALAPEGSIVVPVADPLVTEAEPGSVVMIASEGVVLAASGVVTVAADGVVHVAVDADDAPMVAAAAARSLASVLFVPGDGQLP